MRNHTTRTQKGIKQKGLYKNLYQQIDLNSPGYDDGPSMAAPGASMAQQARAAGYQDIYRDIQADRDAEYKKELSRGEITSEFSGLGMGPNQERADLYRGVRTQKGVRDQNMYKHLMPRTRPIHHPYLPYSIIQQGKGLSGYLGQAAEKTAPGLLVALGLAIAYFLFFRKGKAADIEEPETAEEVFIEEEIEPAAARYYF
jgi:hypothetical protein